MRIVTCNTWCSWSLALRMPPWTRNPCRVSSPLGPNYFGSFAATKRELYRNEARAALFHRIRRGTACCTRLPRARRERVASAAPDARSAQTRGRFCCVSLRRPSSPPRSRTGAAKPRPPDKPPCSTMVRQGRFFVARASRPLGRPTDRPSSWRFGRKRDAARNLRCPPRRL